MIPIDGRITEASDRSRAHFASGYNCAESVLLAVTEYLGIQSEAIPRVATPFGGGMARAQEVCGAVTGGAMAVGMLCGRDEPKGDRAAADARVKAFMQWFRENHGDVTCRALSGVDFSDPEQSAAFRSAGGPHQTICVPLVTAATKYLCEVLGEE